MKIQHLMKLLLIRVASLTVMVPWSVETLGVGQDATLTAETRSNMNILTVEEVMVPMVIEEEALVKYA